MEGPPTVSTEGDIDPRRSGARSDSEDDPNLSKQQQPRSSSSSSSRRRSKYMIAAVVGLIVIVGVIVVLSLSLMGKFNHNASSSTPAASSSSSSEASSSNGGDGGTNANPNSSGGSSAGVSGNGNTNGSTQNSTSVTPVRNVTDNAGGDGTSSNSTSGGGGDGTTGGGSSNSTATTGPDELTIDYGAPYPTDPNEVVDIWSGNAANATSLTLSSGEVVRIRWPECVGMDASGECETLVRSTNPYVNDVYVLGPYDYTTEEFRNDRVNIITDENGVLVAQVPTIG